MKTFAIGFLAFCFYLASLVLLISTLQFFIPGVARNSQYENKSCPNMLSLSMLNENVKPVGATNIAHYNCRFWSDAGFYASPTHYIPPMRMLAFLATTAIIGFLWWKLRRTRPHKSTNGSIALTVFAEIIIVSAIGFPLLMNSWDTKEEYLGVKCTTFSAFSSPSNEPLLRRDFIKNRKAIEDVDPLYFSKDSYNHDQDGNEYGVDIYGNRVDAGYGWRVSEVPDKLFNGPNPTCISLKRIGWISTYSFIVITFTRWTYIFLGIWKSRRVNREMLNS